MDSNTIYSFLNPNLDPHPRFSRSSKINFEKIGKIFLLPIYELQKKCLGYIKIMSHDDSSIIDESLFLIVLIRTDSDLQRCWKRIQIGSGSKTLLRTVEYFFTTHRNTVGYSFVLQMSVLWTCHRVIVSLPCHNMPNCILNIFCSLGPSSGQVFFLLELGPFSGTRFDPPPHIPCMAKNNGKNAPTYFLLSERKKCLQK